MIPHNARFGTFMLVLTAAALSTTPTRATAQSGSMEMAPPGVAVRALENGTKVLADAKGMTLYTFARDSAGKSNCNGRCADNWPPLMASENAMAGGDWSVVTRDDGKKMWAYKTRPLYTFARDEKAGDTNGDGVNGTWKVAVP